MSRDLTIRSEWIYKDDPLKNFNESTDRIITVIPGYDSSGQRTKENFGYTIYYSTPIK